MAQKRSAVKSRRYQRRPIPLGSLSRPNAAELLRSIATNSSTQFGERYFHSLTRYLSQTLDMDYALVGELARGAPDTVNVLSACFGGEIIDNFRYELDHTPCQEIIRRGFCTFPDNVQQRFPKDKYLADLEVECYVGMPLFSSTGQPLGLIVVMDREPLRDRETAGLVLQIVAARTATEIERQHLHQELGESYRTLSTLIANLPGMVYRCRNDPNWTMEFASEGVLALTGYAPADLVQNNEISYAVLIHPEDRHHVWDAVQDALAKKEAFQLEYRILTKAGAEKRVWEQGRGVFTPDGELTALEGFVTDISDRVQFEDALRHNEKLLRTVMDALPVGVWIADRTGKIVSGNPAGRAIWAGAKYVGMDQYGEYKGWWADSGKAIAPEEWALARAITRGETSVNEVIDIQCFDGTRKTMFNSAVPIRARDGAIEGAIVVNQDITEMVQAQKALKENAQFLDRSQRIANVGSWEWDVRTNQVKWSDEMYRVYGLKKTEFDGTFASAMARTHPEDVPKIERIVERMLHQGTTATMEFRIVRPDGRVRWALGQSEPMLDLSGKLVRIVGTVRDITERKLAEDALWENEIKFRTLFESAKDAIFLFKDGVFVDCNPETLRMFGCHRHEILGKSPVQFSPEYQPDGHPSKERAWQKIEAAFGGTPQFFEWVHCRLDGTPFSAEVSLNVIELKGERYLQAIVRDVTERTQARERLQHLAHHDSLTGLPNRPMFLERLNHALSRARWTKRPLAVLFLDLDRFKNINDTLGHDIGDTALKVAAERLLDCVREGDTVARLGGDEFTVLLEDLANRDDVPSIAQKILEALSRPFEVEGREFVVTTSIGISLHSEDGDDSLKLLRNADTAMYRAKEQGRNKYQFYSSEMSAKALEKFMLESSLRHALERREFLLYYQPQVNLANGEIIGVEALLRWCHPELGLVSPAQFIPVAEETGLMRAIDEWVLSTACEVAESWYKAGLHVSMTVNLSGRTFGEARLIEIIARALGKSGLPPELLELEITESAIMQNAEVTVNMLGNLKRMGIRLAVDDFGTGYSSLSYLKRFPIDTLKIDQSFVRDVTEDEDDASIVAAIIALAHSLKLNVIAEGVETPGQLAFLRRQGCNGMQGYLFSRPLPAEEVTDMIRTGKKL